MWGKNSAAGSQASPQEYHHHRCKEAERWRSISMTITSACEPATPAPELPLGFSVISANSLFFLEPVGVGFLSLLTKESWYTSTFFLTYSPYFPSSDMSLWYFNSWIRLRTVHSRLLLLSASQSTCCWFEMEVRSKTKYKLISKSKYHIITLP